MIPFERNLLDTLPALLWPVARRESPSSAPMDVVETADGYRVTVDLPGVRKDAIQVNVHENTLTISAPVNEEKEAGEETRWLLRERTFGNLSRSIALPEAIDDGASEAKFVDGVLQLTLKKARATQSKRLQIQ